MSADGRFVVFSSLSDGLSPGQADDAGFHCYRRDLATGTTVLVDRATGAQGAVGNSGCSGPTISPDGSAVAFTAGSTNLVPGDTNNISDIFVRMVGAGVTYRANVDVNGAQSAGSVFGVTITTTPAVNRINGPTVHVAFATNGSLDPAHDPDAPPGIFDVYLRRSQPLSILAIAPSSTTLISRATGATTNAANGGEPSISRDGTKVVFTTTSNLDAADTGNDRDVYLRDVNANTTTLVSRPDGVAGQADGSSFAPQISDDGGSVAFDSNASNVDDDSGPDVNGLAGRDVYIRRLAANETVTASLASGSLTQRGTGESLDASISSDGNRVAFLTASANLGDGDTDITPDIHVRDLTTNVTTWASRADGPGADRRAPAGAVARSRATARRCCSTARRGASLPAPAGTRARSSCGRSRPARPGWSPVRPAPTPRPSRSSSTARRSRRPTSTTATTSRCRGASRAPTGGSWCSPRRATGCWAGWAPRAGRSSCATWSPARPVS